MILFQVVPSKSRVARIYLKKLKSFFSEMLNFLRKLAEKLLVGDGPDIGLTLFCVGINDSARLHWNGLAFSVLIDCFVRQMRFDVRRVQECGARFEM